MTEPAYRRILLKLSGEALEGEQSQGIDPATLARVCEEIREIVHAGVQVGIVVGGGNLFRGISSSAKQMERATADYIGMLATTMNSLAIQDNLERLGVRCHVQCALNMPQVAEPYIRRKALQYLDQGQVIVFAGGTGNPYFSTDTAAALRASEMRADIFLKATKVDGVYDSDPVKNTNAQRFSSLSYQEVLDKTLKVMDLTAVSLAMENQIPVMVFDMTKKGNIIRVIQGDDIGTLIKA